MDNIQIRTYGLSLGDHAEEQGNRLTGYASVFNAYSVDMGGWREEVKPGAYTRTLQEDDIFAFSQHDKTKVLGRTGNGTLKLWEDATGLGFDADLPDTSYARDLRESVRRGDITTCSIMFYIPKGGDVWETRDVGEVHIVTQATLVEVSIGVTFPAFEQTTIQLRDLYSARESVLERDKEVEKIKTRAKYMAKYFEFATT